MVPEGGLSKWDTMEIQVGEFISNQTKQKAAL
jgi:hypothetical protein